jgi:hypothetical protein
MIKKIDVFQFYGNCFVLCQCQQYEMYVLCTVPKKTNKAAKPNCGPFLPAAALGPMVSASGGVDAGRAHPKKDTFSALRSEI